MPLSPLSTTTTTATLLGKRKERSKDTGILHLASSPSESEPEPSTSTKAPTSHKAYQCPYEGCSKSYTKPSRLAEHERSHTGDRPFVCSTCNKNYLRETHLNAHIRSHLPQSARPFRCEENGCDKRFWTAQHLSVHSKLHTGEKRFKCAELSCSESFLKHHQLREHICSVHAPPGTRPYRCEHSGCIKSFNTNQKLLIHMKTHDEKRYTCVHATCLVRTDSSPVYYPTWSALQHHIRTAHPPICPYPSCNSKTFTAQKNFRAHLKLHEQREMEENLISLHTDSGNSSDEHPPKKRRGGEVGRDFICSIEGCNKDFKSKKSLTTHHKIHHLGHRDFVCPHDECKRAFGYKHLLQRHLAKLHYCGSDSDSDTVSQSGYDSEEVATKVVVGLEIDDITGKTYATRSQLKLAGAGALSCPYPELQALVSDVYDIPTGSKNCEYVFTRAYDFRRHLKVAHGIEADKERVDEWTNNAKKAKASTSN